MTPRVKTAAAVLIVIALVAGLAGCDGSPRVQYRLTISSTAGGSVVEPGEGTFSHRPGTVISLVAEAEEGSEFIGWSGDTDTIASANATATTITMNGDYSISAGFRQLFAGGSGTTGDPFQIADWYQLHRVRDCPHAHFILTGPLDSSVGGYDTLAGPTANEGKGWEPIGTETHRFSGTFNGRGHEIGALYIYRPDLESVGLFGVIDSGGLVENTRVVNASVTGGVAVGGLAGDNWGGTVRNSCFAGSLTGEWYVGGLIGWNEGTVTGSWSDSIVTGSWSVGGLVGANDVDGSVEDSYSCGSVAGGSWVGGLVGDNWGGNITNSYAASSVTGDELVGGLVGLNDGIVGSSFWDTQASGLENSAGGTGKTTAEMMNFSTFTDTETEGLVEPWDMAAVDSGTVDPGHTWNIVPGLTRPFLGWQPVP